MRLFIALPLSKEAVYELGTALEDVRADARLSNFRFVPPENWHITFSFLSNQGEFLVPQISHAVRYAATEHTPPSITFHSLQYGPQARHPRMLWALTDTATSRTLGEIKNTLDGALAERGILFKREHHAFHGHITLARLTKKPLRNYPPTNRPSHRRRQAGEYELKLKKGSVESGLPPLDAPLEISFTATNLALMESRLSRDGAQYHTLATLPFAT